MSLPNDAISPIGARAPEQGSSALVVDIFERSGALFLCLDERGRIVRANPAIAERLGYANDELLSLSLSDLMPSERRDDARALLDRLRAGNTVVSAEATFMTRAGDHVYVRGMLSPRIQDGRPTTAFGVFNEHVVGAPLRSTLGVDPSLLDAMLDASPDGISLFDANETIVAYNRRSLEVWEIEESDVKDGNIRAVILRRLADPDAFLETVNRLYARRGASGSGQLRLLSGRVLDWHSACAYDPDGSYRGRIWYYRDVTDRVHAEESLRRSEELYRRLASSFPDGAVLIYDTELRFLLADGAGLARVGLSRRGVEGRTLSEILPSRMARALEPVFRDALVGRQAADDLRFGGRTYSVTTVPLDAGAPESGVHAMAIVQDVSHQRELEDRLRGAEARFRSLVEQIPAVIYIQKVGNGTNSTVFMSPQVFDFFGYTPEELLADPDNWPETVHPDDRERVLTGTALSNATGAPFSMEYRSITKDGQVRWVRDEAAVIRDERGRARFWQGILSDITDEKLLEQAVRQSEERFRSAFDDAPMGIILIGLDGKASRFNRAISDILGYTIDELEAIGKIRLLTHPDDRAQGLAEFERLLRRETDHYHLEKRLLHRDGRSVWTQMDVSFVTSDDAEPSFIIAQIQDITEERRLREELRQSEAVFRSAFDHAAIGMALVSPEGRWLDANSSICRMLGYSRDELLATDFQTLTHPDDLETDLELVRKVLAGEISSYNLEKRYIHKSGHLVWGLLSVSLVRAADGSPLYFVSQIQDITSRKHLEQQLEYQAHHDQLTGLLNRNGLVRLLDRSDPQDDDIVAVLVVDMDGFKTVNDGFGHHAGDRVLSEIANRIRACLRDDDHVARHGGDEFVVILNGPATWSMAERVAGRIRASIAASITLEDGRTSVSLAASIGIELGPRHQVQGDLMRAADNAMYRAKRERKAALPEQRA